MAYTAAQGDSTLIAGPHLPVVFDTASSMPEAKRLAGPLEDRWGRVATDLRISLTDKCNLRCQYCMPAEGLDWLPNNRVLNAEEIIRIVRVGVELLGVEEIRFTGGEPLLRRDLPFILSSIRQSFPQLPLSLTTNGLGLDKKAEELAAAGLNRINVSLDSICPETFAELTRRDRLKDVIKGIDYAARAGLSPIKINTVLMPGINDHQAAETLGWALERGYQLRFIEQMPIDADGRWSREKTITAADIRALLSEKFTLHKPAGPRGSAPADLWQVFPLGSSDFEQEPLGTVGIIASVTESFCSSCTRTRITADGKIRSCLFSQTETDLMELLRSGASDEELAIRWREGMWFKPKAHGYDKATFDTEKFVEPSRSMSAIGG